MLASLINNNNWQKILIQGKQNSGKSELSLWILDELINKNKPDFWLSRLLGEKEKILLFTEKVSQLELIDNNLYDRIYVVENISTKNYYEYLVNFHNWSHVEVLIIDYINLLNSQSHLMKDLIKFVNEKNIKTIFVENTYKLLKADLIVQNESDYIIETTRGNHGLEIVLRKEEGKNLVYPKSFWIDFNKIPKP